MAINVNTVYQTVLLILNKEQRGYMTPVEFNKIGAQVQLEIFESYFDSLNQQLRVPQADVDYSDRVMNLDEKISIFKTSGAAIYDAPSFSLPKESGVAQSTETLSTIINQQAYTYTTLTSNQLSNGTVQVYFDGVLQPSSSYTITNNIISLTVSPASVFTVLTVVDSNDFYRLGTVTYQAGALPYHELERVGRSELYHLLGSNLTKPTTRDPIYIYENKKITVYPSTITSGINIDYIRKPLAPIWNFTLNGNAYQYNEATSINFELHDADQTELILKILLYAGVVVKSMEIVQIADQQVQQENINQQR
jgi:hypothetical protein|tara:strand:+ start:980 stop:1903 length:924 start_codon:yes stop_codon:yes gene_type:complete